MPVKDDAAAVARRWPQFDYYYYYYSIRHLLGCCKERADNDDADDDDTVAVVEAKETMPMMIKGWLQLKRALLQHADNYCITMKKWMKLTIDVLDYCLLVY